MNAATVTVRSGNGSIGGTDAYVRFLIGPSFGPFGHVFTAADFASAQTGPPAFILAPNPLWISGLSEDPFAQWIGTSLDADTATKLQEIADQFLDKRNPSTHNQAIMELGATVCLPRQPKCLICPLQTGCRGRSRAEDFPVKSRTPQVKRTEIVAIIQHGKSFYCEQVPAGKPWHGLWRFPDFDPARMTQGGEIGRIKYGITKYSVVMQAVSAKWKSRVPAAGRYLTFAQMEALAFAAPHRKLAKLI